VVVLVVVAQVRLPRPRLLQARLRLQGEQPLRQQVREEVAGPLQRLVHEAQRLWTSQEPGFPSLLKTGSKECPPIRRHPVFVEVAVVVAEVVEAVVVVQEGLQFRQLQRLLRIHAECMRPAAACVFRED